LTKPSSLPDRLEVHVGGVGHPGKVKHQVDVVVLVVGGLEGGVNDIGYGKVFFSLLSGRLRSHLRILALGVSDWHWKTH